MCMLTGIYPARKLTEDEKKFARALSLNLIEVNGRTNTHGTGYFDAQSGLLFRTNKQADEVIFEEGFFDDFQNVQLNDGFIGHVRIKSAGGLKVENCHPFHENGLVLAHNGTFRNYEELAKEHKVNISGNPTDSHVLTSILSQKEYTLKGFSSVLEEVMGSYCLLTYSQKEGKFFVIRGNNNLHYLRYGPLHIINTSKSNLIRVLFDTLNFARSFGFNWDVEEEYELNRFTLYSFDNRKFVEVGKLPNVKVKKVIYTQTSVDKGTTTYIGKTKTSTNYEKAKYIRKLRLMWRDWISFYEFDIIFQSIDSNIINFYDLTLEQLKTLDKVLSKIKKNFWSEEKVEIISTGMRGTKAHEIFGGGKFQILVEEFGLEVPLLCNEINTLKTFFSLCKESEND